MRHSIFVIGNAGTGKSKILRSLNKTYANMKLKPVWVDLNPKAVTTYELYGFINPATREWKDGQYHYIYCPVQLYSVNSILSSRIRAEISTLIRTSVAGKLVIARVIASTIGPYDYTKEYCCTPNCTRIEVCD